MASYRRALEIKPNYAEAHNNMGLAFQTLWRLDDAVASYRRALQINPDSAEAHNNLGNAFYELRRLDDAVASYLRALQIKPDYAEAHYNLGNVLKATLQLDGAVASYRRALEIRPDYSEAHLNLGNVLYERGRLDEAVATCHRVLKIKPDNADAHSNLLFFLDMMATVGLPEVQGERRKWDEAHAAPLWQEPVHANDRSPTRRLRVGYVSGDLREHSASKTFIGILTQYDRSQFEVFAYSNYKGKGDVFTERFRQGEIGRASCRERV